LRENLSGTKSVRCAQNGRVCFRAITPLVWEHINPYDRYELDMDSRFGI